jgi:general secretion pathway protein F
MPAFTYTALKRDGSVSTGDMNANDKADAIRRLERNQLQPVSVKPKDSSAAEAPKAEKAAPKPAPVKPAEKAAPAKPDPKAPPAERPEKAKAAAAKQAEDPPKRSVKLSKQQVILLTEELSDLLGAGLQLEPALKIMESRDELSALKDVTVLLRSKIRDGTSFAAALRESSPNFGELYCNMAQAGEISGALPKILKRQAEYMTAIQNLQSTVTKAMIYPVILFLVSVVVGVLFITNLIPQLTGLLKTMGKPMPLPAVIINKLGDFFSAWWWLLLIIIIGAIYAFQYFTNLPKYKESWHEKLMDLPIVGPLLRSRFYVQMLETLSNLVGNGLPLLRALELTREATVNLFQRNLLNRVVGMVSEGSSLSKSLKKVGFFPPLLTDMVAVGEQTGDIEHSLVRTAQRYDKELQKVIDSVMALLQPLILLAMALIVGMLAYMMIDVIMDSMNSMRGNSGGR